MTEESRYHRFYKTTLENIKSLPVIIALFGYSGYNAYHDAKPYIAPEPVEQKIVIEPVIDNSDQFNDIIDLINDLSQEIETSNIETKKLNRQVKYLYETYHR